MGALLALGRNDGIRAVQLLCFHSRAAHGNIYFLVAIDR